MAALRWAMLCDRTIIEAGTNNLSIINVLDEIHLAQAPPEQSAKEKRPLFISHQFTVVQLWSRTDDDKPEKFSVRAQFMSPDRKTYGGVEQLVDLSEHVQSSRVIARAPGFPWRGAGEYSATIQVKTREKWRTVARLPFKVAVVIPPKEIAAIPPPKR